jgi:hypothetical protein
MGFAEDSVLVEGKFFTCGELPMASGTREAGEVVHVVAGFTNPVAGGDASGAHRTLCSKASATENFKIKIII